MQCKKNSTNQEKFAQELAKGKTLVEAGIAAGYKPNGKGGNLSTLANSPSVKARVAELLAGGAKRAEVTIASMFVELEEARQIAAEQKQASAMVAATMGKAKLAGLLVDRTELTGKDGAPIQTEEVKARDKLAARIAHLSSRRSESESSGKPN